MSEPSYNEIEVLTPEQEAAVAEAYGVSEDGPRRKKRVRKAMAGDNIGSLNLTPMMDMMTILLVFLVKNFMTDPQAIQINDTLRPPESSVTVDVAAATTITITSVDILVDNKSVLKIADLAASGSKEVAIPKLRDELLNQVALREALAKRGGPPFDGKLLLVAHNTTPYSLITSVLYTSGEAKFSSYRLVVLKKEDPT